MIHDNDDDAPPRSKRESKNNKLYNSFHVLDFCCENCLGIGILRFLIEIGARFSVFSHFVG